MMSNTFQLKTAPLAILFFLVVSCAAPTNLHKIQSDNQLRKTEDLNFSSTKARTQWWYYDCVFEDGSVLVFLFTPYQWWNEHEKTGKDQALCYISYMDSSGVVKRESKVMDVNDVVYTKNGISSSYFTLTKAHGKNTRNYEARFNFDNFKGTALMHSNAKAFSPFPIGKMGEFATKHILKRPGKHLAFRYAAHIPQGDVTCNLIIDQREKNLKGQVYHEQGWFSGLPEQMGKGWSWFHFVSDDINVFGTPENFICLEKDGKRILGGPNIFDKGAVLSNITYDNDVNRFILGGNLKYTSKVLSFEIKDLDKSITLINIPSLETDQVWGTVAQRSVFTLKYKGREFKQEGWLFLETCKMGLKNP